MKVFVKLFTKSLPPEALVVLSSPRSYSDKEVVCLKEFLCIGKIVKPQGIRGELKVAPDTDDLGRFAELRKVWVGEGGEVMRVVNARLREGCAFLTLEGVNDRDEAERLRGKELFVDRENAVKLPEGRYFIADMVGLAVVDEDGNELGVLKEVLQAGGNDVYRVDGDRPFMFPAVKKAIVRVDLEEGRMVVLKDALLEIAVYDED